MLVADDGSKPAARARAFAITLAAATGARLTAVYVRDPLETPEEAADKLAVTIAAAAAAGLKCKGIIQRPVGITSSGRRIIATATAQRADMIVVGARGSGTMRKLLGSVSSYVVTNASVSVTVVR
jgi:nucleotide-binding universal stress UspA family protein